jgi:predicted TIM-barrel fold metal-dependent hydrolase
VADLLFTDTHVHFWDRRLPELGGYQFLDAESEHPELGDYGAIKMLRYWADDFIAETRFANVGNVIHVQAAVGIKDAVEETKWLQAFADRLDVPQGIVAYVDLASPNASETLRRHRAYGNLCGIRDLRYDNYLANGEWERGFSLLAEYELICCDDPIVEVMADAARLAGRHPEITYCVDHAGFPRRRDKEYFSEWKAGMRKLAAVPSTVVKISGLGMCDHSWTIESLRPWVHECIEAWGTERSFFGTNWPVDRLFSSYGDILDAYRELICDFTNEEQHALFHSNADKIFRLETTNSDGGAKCRLRGP